ncbi:MAG: V-type ATP synthase subunit I [Candidatus Izemoplasmatales bacterium]
MIVAMKKASVAVLAEDRERLLESLQRSGTLMPVKPGENIAAADSSDADALAIRTEKSLKLLERYKNRKLVSDQEPATVDYDSFAIDDPVRIELLREVETLDETVQRLKGEAATLQSERAALLPWIDLEIPLSELGRRGSTVVHAGIVPPSRLAAVESEAASVSSETSSYGSSPEGVALVVAAFAEDDAAAIERIRAAGFVEAALPRIRTTAREALAEKDERLAGNAAALAAAESRLSELSGRRTPLEVLNDRTLSASERLRTPVAETTSAAFLEGWVRVDQIDRLRAALDRATDVYDLELTDPAPDETPPTAVKNNRFVTAFETITDMFAKPSYGEIDPNPVMSIWYWMLFGMMMADVGYGVVMAVLFSFLIKKMRAKGETLKLLKLLLYTSVTTIFWGLLFNSYFGASIGFMSFLQILNPVEDTMVLLGISLFVGVLHIFTGLIMKAANNLRKKDLMAVFADSFAWILLITGLGMLLVPSLITLPDGAKIAAAGKWVAIAGAAVIVLFAGRSVKNPIGRIGSGLYALYGVTGYLGDIMSYSRVLALALTSAIIGQVMNQLAGMVQGVHWYGILFAIPIYVVGHVFNLVMGLLSAYVHTSRLQFIEFYAKFYEGAGYEFRPLSIQSKYVDVRADGE